MQSIRYYTTGQVADLLQITPPTLRRWTAILRDYLSPETNPTQRRQHRRFAEQDIVVLQRAQELMRTGTPLDELAQRLATEPDTGDQVVGDREQLTTIAETLTRLADQHERISRLEAEMAVLRQQLDAITSEIHPPAQDDSSAAPTS